MMRDGGECGECNDHRELLPAKLIAFGPGLTMESIEVLPICE
jgi:hypothetical protein